ncbi:MAG: hypothetical protein K2X69_16555 [Silvanigrellaceae bacterium]|nr:hypothetical protein [Silvanigrellaceae bacterium]
MKHSFASRFERCGPGGRKCACCNPFHGKSKSMLTRQVRNSLKHFFNKEIKSELSE